MILLETTNFIPAIEISNKNIKNLPVHMFPIATSFRLYLAVKLKTANWLKMFGTYQLMENQLMENTNADYKSTTSSPTHSSLQAFPVTNWALLPLSLKLHQWASQIAQPSQTWLVGQQTCSFSSSLGLHNYLLMEVSWSPVHLLLRVANWTDLC